MHSHYQPSAQVLTEIVETLCRHESYYPLWHRGHYGEPMPSVDTLIEIVELLRAVLFPGYFGAPDLKQETMQYHIGATLDRVHTLLSEQVQRGFCFSCTSEEASACSTCKQMTTSAALNFIKTLPKVRSLLASDVQAAYKGDPAAKSPGETIYCYPSIKAMTNYRIAHELWLLQVPLIPRVITEIAHSETGIDIHPGATIGESFFMDHGTGVVIGETCVIGKNVRLYQGVTLGARSFPLDAEGKPIKGIARHPLVEDDVIIYSGATVLGRITIGKGAVIGGNTWITQDVPPGRTILLGNKVTG